MLGVQPDHGLVDDKHFGFVQQRGNDGHALPRAMREAFNRFVQEVLQVKSRAELLAVFLKPILIHAKKLAGKPEEFPRGQLIVQKRKVRNKRHLAPCFQRRWSSVYAALSDGRLYFGDYSGRAYALNAGDGSQMWAVNTTGADFGFGSGNFYSTPAVAFGRVYMGNTDGRVYSFAAKTGQLAWATGTGGYVYASAAVQDTPGLGPTVYVGSYDGNFYAFNAQSGSIRWMHAAHGRISGSATIVGNVVYYSDLGTKTTAGLDVRTGHRVFFFWDGAFNPAIADDGAIYLVGYSKIYQMLPTRGRAARRH